MTINVDLLTRTLAHIEEHPEEWDQRNYRCRTTMCFAGWTAQLAGGQWLSSPSEPWAEYLVPEPDDHDDDVFTLDGGTRCVAAHERAQRLLGLNADQADDLFSGVNNLDYLRVRVADLVAEAES